MWAELPDDVLAELEDPNFENRTHGIRGTYARGNTPGTKGCRGPLCRKAERDDAELKYAARQAKLGKTTKKGVKNEEARARDELLARIILWHSGQRYLAKLNRLVQPDLEPEDILEESA
jgi:hypothetical protein